MASELDSDGPLLIQLDRRELVGLAVEDVGVFTKVDGGSAEKVIIVDIGIVHKEGEGRVK